MYIGYKRKVKYHIYYNTLETDKRFLRKEKLKKHL